MNPSLTFRLQNAALYVNILSSDLTHVMNIRRNNANEMIIYC